MIQRAAARLIRPWQGRVSPSIADPLLRIALLLVAMGVIFAFSSIPGSDLPGNFDDRIAHFCEYTSFGLVVALAVNGFVLESGLLRELAALAFGVGYAASDELHQSLVPGRTPDVKDLAFDTLGIVAALVIIRLLLRSASR